MKWALAVWLLLAGCGDPPGPIGRGADGGGPGSDASVELDGSAHTDAASAADAAVGVDAATDDCPRVAVTTVGERLNVRAEPTLGAMIVTTVEEGTVLSRVSTATGEAVDGETTWYEIDTGLLRGYITARFAECTTDAATFGPFDGFRLPLECGRTATISQGNNTSFSHQGLSAYAFDFSLARGTSLHAMADGVVMLVKDDTNPGDPCYDGGGSECVAAANIVKLRHADGTVTSYAHLDAALVTRGQSVRSGAPVGLSGSSGWSTGPHAHVAREEPECGSGGCPSMPLSFLDVEGDGVPATGDSVTSGNCP